MTAYAILKPKLLPILLRSYHLKLFVFLDVIRISVQENKQTHCDATAFSPEMGHSPHLENLE